MAEEIWRAGRLIGGAEGLQFALNLSPDDPEGLAWGEGQILMEGEPVWVGEGPEGEEIPLVWTWIDLLEFLGRWWPWLIMEEDYPLPVKPLYPAFFIQEAERRWLELPEDQVEEEEEIAHRFIARHDLADAFKGLFLPSLMLLRQGKTCHISVAAAHRTWVRPWSEVQDTLEKAGECLAASVLNSSNPRAAHALSLWRQRKKRLEEKELDISTSLSQATRNRFHGIDWRSSEIRAAARMSSGAVVMADQEELLACVAAAPRVKTPELDRLAALIRAEFAETGPPHEQGYWAAGRLRRELGADERKAVDPRKFLEQWGVLVWSFHREGCPVEAVAAWGDDHGPVIIVVNKAASSRAGHEHGERATLAHEIAHLILDREGAVPAGEVLGGRTPEYPEKRARAFAAEFLLPRKTAEAVVRSQPSLLEAANILQKTYRISTELLAWQINNSSARRSLTDEERTRLEQWKTGMLPALLFPSP